MDRKEYISQLKKLLQQGLHKEAMELEQSMLRQRKKTSWSPEYGWITEEERKLLSEGYEVAITEDEKIRGYRLTFNERSQ